MEFTQPPLMYNSEGKLRTVGFELEYSNLPTERAIGLIQDLYGGEAIIKNRFRQKVKNSCLGDFSVEFDLTLLTNKGYRKYLEPLHIKPEEIKLGDRTLEQSLETALEQITGFLFPYEIACPPVPLNRLHELEQLRQALFQNQAEGTDAFPTNAFGTHINAEIPDPSTETILRYLRAFLLLYPWLLEVSKPDMARRLSPFIAAYPDAYAQLVLNPAYAPNLDEFIADYHTHNPDRNRPLDLYPLLASLRTSLTTTYSGLGKVKPRQTFHYRLPNSSVSDPDWTLAKEWNTWVMVEKLAANQPDITSLSHEFLTAKPQTLLGWESKWARRMQEWAS